MKKKIFLFGSGGFVGSYFKNKYKNNKSFKTISYKNNHSLIHKKKANDMISFWKKILKKTDTIVYLSFNNNLEDINKNFEKNLVQTLLPLTTLNETILTLKKKIRVIYLSTASIYGDQKNLPVNENANVKILNRYDLLKSFSENILINSNNKFIDYQILRLSNVYGPNLSQKKQDNRQVLTKIIQTCLKKQKLNIFGKGNFYRDYIHLDDVSDIIKKISIDYKTKKNQIYNIGSGKKIKLVSLFKSISKKIEKKINKKITLKYVKIIDNNKKSIIRNYQSDIKKAKIYLNWVPKINLEDGIDNLINFINENN